MKHFGLPLEDQVDAHQRDIPSWGLASFIIRYQHLSSSTFSYFSNIIPTVRMFALDHTSIYHQPNHSSQKSFCFTLAIVYTIICWRERRSPYHPNMWFAYCLRYIKPWSYIHWQVPYMFCEQKNMFLCIMITGRSGTLFPHFNINFPYSLLH